MSQHLWWIQDGATAHKLLAATQKLVKVFGNRICQTMTLSGLQDHDTLPYMISFCVVI